MSIENYEELADKASRIGDATKRIWGVVKKPLLYGTAAVVLLPPLVRGCNAVRNLGKSNPRQANEVAAPVTPVNNTNTQIRVDVNSIRPTDFQAILRLDKDDFSAMMARMTDAEINALNNYLRRTAIPAKDDR